MLILLTSALVGGMPGEASGETIQATITSYFCDYIPGYFKGDGGGYCGPMASGYLPFEGAAACGSYYALYTWVWIYDLQKWVICLDRGYLGATQIDVFYQTNKDMELSGVLAVGVSAVEVQE